MRAQHNNRNRFIAINIALNVNRGEWNSNETNLGMEVGVEWTQKGMDSKGMASKCMDMESMDMESMESRRPLSIPPILIL